MFALFFYVALVTLSLFSLSGYGGTADSGGSDVRGWDDDTALFLTADKVRSCIKYIADDFGFDRIAAKKEIEAAGATWSHYIEQKKIADHFNPIYGVAVPSTKIRFPKGVVVLDECDGSEEITYFLGKLPEKSDLPPQEDARKELQKYTNPLAFYKKLSFDEKTGRGKGYIFVKGHLREQRDPQQLQPPGQWDWTAANLHAILLHEQGHYHGITYVENTVMRPEQKPFIDNGSARCNQQIDHSIELAPPAAGSDWGFVGHITRTPSELLEPSKYHWHAEEVEERTKLFTQLTGQAPKDANKVEARYIPAKGLELKDGKITKIMSIKFDQEESVKFILARAFRLPKYKDAGQRYLPVNGYVQRGVMTTGDQTTLNVELEYNSSQRHGPYRLFLLSDDAGGKRKAIFYTSLCSVYPELFPE